MAATVLVAKAIAILALLATLSTQAMGEEMLFSGDTLKTGQFLESGPYRFIMQADCNLVLYINGTRPLWSSRTDGKGTNCTATLQNNGNLVVLTGNNDVAWTSETARGPNNYRLIVQDDGNVVIYGAALWATNTVQSGNRRRLL